MDAGETDRDRRFSRLSLIDFASEDDFLLPSPSCDLHDVNSLDEEDNNLKELETVDSIDNLGQKEDGPQLLPSLEPDRTTKNGKYNLRKSLAWDSAFFTSAGFLDPEELTSMIGQGKNEKRVSVLPKISEDVQKSSDSISTLESEIMPLESIEGNLFEDVRASIQKSSRLIGKANSRSKAESGRPETRKPPSAGKLDLTSQTKIQIKDKSTSSKQTDGLQGPGRTIKQNSSQPRSGQAVSKLPQNSALTKKPSPSLGLKPPAIVRNSTTSGVGPAERRDSVSLRNTTQKVNRISTAAKKEQRTSSEGSVSSSDKVVKSSSKEVKKKTECKASPSSGSIRKTAPSRVASKVKENSAGNSRVASFLISQSKHSSGISPASSISEWSTESSSNSTIERRSIGSRASLHSISSKRISIDSDASHDGRSQSVGPRTQTTTGSPSPSVKKASSQSSLIPPASMKPSGLRLPSPKIGYFDGGKTSSMKSNLAVPGGSTKSGAGNVSSSVGQNKTRPSKLQPARVLPKNTTRSNIPYSTNSKSNKPGATRMSKTNEDRQIKEVGFEGSNTNVRDSDVCAESNKNSGASRKNMSQESDAGCIVKATTTSTDVEPNRSPDVQI